MKGMQVFGVRAHEADPATLKMYWELVKDFGPASVWIVADEISAQPATWPREVLVARITPDLLAQHGLRSDIPDCGWRCGDYAHLALSQASGCDRAWLVEPDVCFWKIRPRNFFSLFDGDDVDFIAHSIQPAATSSWEWTGVLTQRGFRGHEWRAFFPLTRLSYAGVRSATALRREVQYSVTDVMHPNDEIVVASAVVRDSLTWMDAESRAAGMFQAYTYGQRRPAWLQGMFTHGPQVLHPVGSRRAKRTVFYRSEGTAARIGDI